MQDMTSFDAKLMWGSPGLYILLIWAQIKNAEARTNLNKPRIGYNHTQIISTLKEN